MRKKKCAAGRADRPRGNGRGRFILRAVYTHLVAGLGPLCKCHILGTFGTGQVTATVTAVGNIFTQITVQEDFCKDRTGIGMIAILIVIHGKNMKLIHIFH